jgi:hypothetical protein
MAWAWPHVDIWVTPDAITSIAKRKKKNLLGND